MTVPIILVSYINIQSSRILLNHEVCKFGYTEFISSQITLLTVLRILPSLYRRNIFVCFLLRRCELCNYPIWEMEAYEK